MKKHLILLAALFATGCSDNKTIATPEGDVILLYHRGEFKKTEVKKTGAYCTVAWYKSIDNFVLHRDGTALDNAFEYRWTLSEFGNEIDKIWFDKNCKEPN